MIYTDFEQFKSFVGGAVSQSMYYASISPYIETAAFDHIIPVLGEEQWQDLVDNFSEPSQDQIALLPYVQKPLAFLSVYEYSKIGNVQFGSSGILRTETAEMKTAFKYQENEYRNSMLLNGYEALERMQKFLDQNADTYTIYAESTAIQSARGSIVNYASEFRANHPTKISRYTFEIIKPIIFEVEEFALRPLLGDGQFDRIKAGILAADLTTDEKVLLAKLKKCVVQFTITEALARLMVQIKGDRIIQVERSEPQSFEVQTSASHTALSLKMLKEDQASNRYLKTVETYLNSNPTKFPLYKTHIDAIAASESAEDTTETNERPSRCCILHPYCNCQSNLNDRGGVVML